MLVEPYGTHYMPIVHSKLSYTNLGAWTTHVLKNGVLQPSIGVKIVWINKQFYVSGRRPYVWSFVNDGTPNSFWTLIVIDRFSPYEFYQQSWNVVANVDTNKQVKYLRSRLDSDGGYTGKDRA